MLPCAGPYKVNGVPLRRVNQRYVIATSTKVDVTGVAVPDTVNDAFFKRPATKSKATEGEFFSTEAEVRHLCDGVCSVVAGGCGSGGLVMAMAMAASRHACRLCGSGHAPLCVGVVAC